MATPSLTRVQRLHQYLQSDPENMALQCELCDALLEGGRVGEALEVIQPGLTKSPPTLGLRYRLGVIQRRQGDLQDARATLGALVMEGTNASAVLYELGCVHVALHEWDAAAQLLVQLRQAPEYYVVYPEADLFLLRSLHHKGQIEMALEHGRAVMEREYFDPRILSAMATLYIDNAQIANTAELLRIARQVETANLPPELQAELESAAGFLALDQQDFDLARRQFEVSLECTENFARSLLGLGLVEAAQGNLPRAEQLMEATVRAMPRHLGSWHTLAWVQLLQDDVAAAQQTFEHALELDPTFAESHGGVALMAALRGDVDSARDSIRTALRLDKNSMNAMAAKLVLEHGSLKSPDLIRTALPLLAKRPGLGNTSMRETVLRLVQRRQH